MASTETERPELIEVDVRTDEILLNMGPQHPSTHGVLRLLLRCDGEIIKEVVPHIGYLHRCAEKIGENLATFQFIPYTDRLDYLAAMNMNLGFALAVEKLTGLEVPQRAQIIRVIMCELNRVASHLVCFGTYGLDLGAWTPFLYAFREREKILDLFEEVCGARLTYSYITIGGLTYDLPDGWVQRCCDFLDYMEPKIEEYHGLLTRNVIFINRTAGIGVLPPKTAIAYGTSGPVLRGSGVNHDLRRDEPYSMYDQFKFEVACPPFPEAPPEAVIGDSWHRYYVRMVEIVWSLKIVRQALERLPDAKGPHRSPEWKPTMRLPAEEVYLETK